MMKDSLRFFVAALVGGLIVVLAASSGIISFQSALITATPSPQPEVSETPDERQKLVSEAALRTVAVQTFQGSKLLRSGSGLILSSDGLIATTYDAAPFFRPASETLPYVYQVLQEDKVFRAVPVARDYNKNLALLKVQALDLSVAALESSLTYESGKDLALVGKLVSFSRPILFSQRASILYAAGNSVMLDTVPNNFLSGAAVIDLRGRCFGLVSIRGGKPLLVETSTIRGFLDSYLNSVKK